MSATQSPHWYILGAGAIGRLWACYLQLAGYQVTLLMRNSQRLNQYSGSITLDRQSNNQTLNIAAQLVDADEPIQQLLVTTKSYDCLDAVECVLQRLQPDADVVLLQNGMGQQQQIARLLDTAKLYAATTTEGAFTSDQDRLTHAGRGETWFGPFNPAAQNAGNQPLASLLAILNSDYDQQIIRRLWQKLAINGAINGLTALFDCRNGELTGRPEYSQRMQQLCDEIEELTARLQQPLFERPLFEQATQVAQATAANFSSMLVDVRSDAMTEIDFINGFICQQADQLGLELPHNRALTKQIRSRHPTDMRAEHG